MMTLAVALNVLFVIAEMAPLVKVGGLGDIGRALPRALRELGDDVRVALPYYQAIDRERHRATSVAELPDDASLRRTDVAGMPVYLVEHGRAFGRDDVYGYDDDGARFLAFCDALLAAAGALGWQPDALHLHDWHPGLLATRLEGAPEHPWAGLPRIATIHNLGFTGPFDLAFARDHDLTALEPPSVVEPKLADSALAQSILGADLVTTVSPTYAREILTPEFGGALTPLLEGLGDRLSGILNGIDVVEFDPATDAHLTARFDVETIERRIENKLALQRVAGLPVDANVPLVGMVSRLFWQKGSDLATGGLERLLAGGRLQFVALGQGDEEHETPLRELARRYPERAAVRIAFDAPFGQLIYGGCDVFLMPSRYEPCGLGQFIAMRYGAVPVVRRTGGLADSVEPYDAVAASGTGFLFDGATPEAVAGALEQAFAAYEHPAAWRELQRRGMRRDWSWARAAAQYHDLYARAVRMREGTPAQ